MTAWSVQDSFDHILSKLISTACRCGERFDHIFIIDVDFESCVHVGIALIMSSSWRLISPACSCKESHGRILIIGNDFDSLYGVPWRRITFELRLWMCKEQIRQRLAKTKAHKLLLATGTT